jgi:glyceraldehyde 3-phosphate dehydrogenase
LLDEYSIKNAHFVTTHAYTATQKLIDGYDKKDMLRGRAAAMNIVPTTSGASHSVVECLPELAGKLDGYALRVPVPDGSITSVFAEVGRIPKAEEVSALFKKRALGDLKEFLAYNEDSLASSDIVHNPASCIFDANFTSVVGDLVSIAGWYDNEWGYSNRLVDVAKLMLHNLK